MPQSAAQAIDDRIMAVIMEHLDNARKEGMEYEWMQWFVGGIALSKLDPIEAATEATIEWDL